MKKERDAIVQRRFHAAVVGILLLTGCLPFAEEKEDQAAEDVRNLTFALALRTALGNTPACASESFNQLSVGSTWDSSTPGSVLTPFAGGALFMISTSGPAIITVTTSGSFTARVVLYTNPVLVGAFANDPTQPLPAAVANLCFEVQIMAGALPFQVLVN